MTFYTFVNLIYPIKVLNLTIVWSQIGKQANVNKNDKKIWITWKPSNLSQI